MQSIQLSTYILKRSYEVSILPNASMNTLQALKKITDLSEQRVLSIPNSLMRPYFYERTKQDEPKPLAEDLKKAISDKKSSPFMATLAVFGTSHNYAVQYSNGGVTLQFVIPREFSEINYGLKHGQMLVFDLATIYSFEHGRFTAPKKVVNAILSPSREGSSASITPNIDMDLKNAMKLVKPPPWGGVLSCNDATLYVPSLAPNAGQKTRIPVTSYISTRQPFISLLTGDAESISVDNLLQKRPLLILKG